MKKTDNKKGLLHKKYEDLCNDLGISSDSAYNNIGLYIRKILNDFYDKHERVAIYCYGIHTQMLMADYVSELRNTVCIIDNGVSDSDSEYKIIKGCEIEDYDLDGIVVSSYKYREEIKKGLFVNHNNIDVLDIYDELARYGVFLENEFFCAGPYQKYKRINNLNNRLHGSHSDKESISVRRELVNEFVHIKDFRMARKMVLEILDICDDDNYKAILNEIAFLYDAEISNLNRLDSKNVVLMCLDGFMRNDLLDEKLKKISDVLGQTSLFFNNAYSYSTMTYESLIPAFTENTDQKTEYYLNDEAQSSTCRFISKAVEQNRFIAIYGDGNHYIYDESIKYSGSPQTVTEKIWDFTIDSEGVENGLFYIHEMYESHYSFSNPYTTGNLISHGAAMLFDYLPQNGGHLKTDYQKQQEDAIRYLDDTLAPFINALSCNLIIFADHGNLVLPPDCKLSDVRPIQLTASEGWIRIPLIVRSKCFKPGVDNDLISLMDINDIMIAVLTNKSYDRKKKDYIKIGRSAIYNGQFRQLFKLMNCDYNGEAFEGFIFNNGYKLLVFSNGKTELYSTDDDSTIEDREIKDELYQRIRNEITVLQ